jgi:hypothetical protein
MEKPMISVLSLVVAILAVFFGPLVARANTQRQIRATAREAWIREFREQAATLMAAKAAPGFFDPSDQSRGRRRGAEVIDMQNSAFFALRILIAEKGTKYEAFAEPLRRFLESKSIGKPVEEVSGRAPLLEGEEFVSAAADILQRERAATGVEGAPLWARLKTWATGRPHFPN